MHSAWRRPKRGQMANKKQSKEYAYPWAELYDMESRIAVDRLETGKKGRPQSVYIKHRTTLMLSDEEISMLARNALNLQEILRPGSVTKSQVFGLAVRLLDARMGKLGNRKVRSWEEVVRALLEE